MNVSNKRLLFKDHVQQAVWQVGFEQFDNVRMFELATNARLSIEVFDGEARTRNELLNVDNFYGEYLICFAMCTFANHAERATWKTQTIEFN